MSGYRAAIDFGTSYTVAASRSRAQAAPVVVPLTDEGRLSSAVALDDSGELRAGPLVEQVAALTPDRVERTPKRCLDQPDVMLGRKPIETADLVAAVLVYVQDELHLHFNGRDAQEVILTHPARWEPGDPRMKRLEEAAQQVGLQSVRFLPEPCAAALALAADGQLEVSEGDLIAVYDLGGGTFDTALLNCAPGGSFALVGEPGGDPELGGEWLDDRLSERLSGQLPPEDEANLRDPDSSPDPRRWRRAGAAFRQEIRKAKERLAREVNISIPLNPPFSLEQLSLSRAELERTAIPLITKSADRFELFLQRNGKTPEDVAAICLVGGSSRLTIVNRILGNRFGRPVCTHGDPKAVTALGALFDLRSQTAYTTAAPPDSSYPEDNEQLKHARWEQRRKHLIDDVRRLHAAQQWDAAIAAGQELANFDPATPDPDGLITQAREALAEKALASRYTTGLQQLDNEDWLAALKTFADIEHDRPGYRDTPTLLRQLQQRQQKQQDQGPRTGSPVGIDLGTTVYESFLRQGRNWSGFRRRRHGESSHNPAWTATDEVFIDPVSNRVMRVWIDPESGDRHYVAEPPA